MKTERNELTLCVPDKQCGNTFETFHVLRMMDENGNEGTWEMRGFLNDLFPPLRFKTEKEYLEHVKECDWAFIFPKWEQISLPGVGAYLTTLSNELTPNEIHQWLYDILFEMRSHLNGFKVKEKVQVETMVAMPLPKVTVGILLNKPQNLLDVLYMPEIPDFVNPVDGLKNSILAYMSLGHDQIPCGVTTPVIWNLTQNKPNVFRRGDRCKVRFVNCGRGQKMYEHPEWMVSWATQPFNEIWKLWQ